MQLGQGGSSGVGSGCGEERGMKLVAQIATSGAVRRCQREASWPPTVGMRTVEASANGGTAKRSRRAKVATVRRFATGMCGSLVRSSTKPVQLPAVQEVHDLFGPRRLTLGLHSSKICLSTPNCAFRYASTSTPSLPWAARPDLISSTPIARRVGVGCSIAQISASRVWRSVTRPRRRAVSAVAGSLSARA